MFIREIKKRIKKNGKSYDYVQHRLVESVRTPNGPRQRIVLNLGTLDVAPTDYKALANFIESLANNDEQPRQQMLFSCPEKLETIARHFAEVLIRKRIQEQELLNEISQAEKQAEQQTAKYVEIDVNSVIATGGRKIGAEHIVLSHLKEIGFFEILTECDFSEDQQKYAAAQVCSRLIHPKSERETARWLGETSGLDEFLGVDFSKISDHTLHRSADQLLAVKEILEEQLSETTNDLFSLNNTLVLYDLTNTYFESPKSKSDMAKYHRSKEKRNDCPLLTLALTVDEFGFPKRSEILPGNTSEPGTLFEMLEKLPQRSEDDGPQTVIIDAGIATDENLAKMRRDARFEYVAVNRGKLDIDGMFGDVESQTIALARNKSLKVKLVRQDDEAFVLCQSEDRRAKEKAMFDRRKTKFEQELTLLNEGLKKPRTTKKYDKVLERIGRIKERYKVGKYYDVIVAHSFNPDVTNKKTGEQGEEQATAVRWIFHPEKAKKPGQYVIRTSRTDLNGEQISSLHRTLTMIESSFRWLKSDLGLRPNYHHYDHRMEAHIFVSVLAYYVLAPILNRLHWGGEKISANSEKKKKNNWQIPSGWAGVVNALESHTRVTTTYRCKGNKTMDIRTTLEPTAKQFEIYRRLNVTPRPLKNTVHMTFD